MKPKEKVSRIIVIIADQERRIKQLEELVEKLTKNQEGITKVLEKITK